MEHILLLLLLILLNVLLPPLTRKKWKRKDSETEQNGAYSTSSAHSLSRPAATIDNKEEETSYAEVFSVKANGSSVFEIMNYIASSFATNFLKQLEMHKLESQMISIKNKCDQLNKESSLTWREFIT